MHLNNLRLSNEHVFVSEQTVSRMQAMNLGAAATSVEPFYRIGMSDLFQRGIHVLFTVPAAYSPQCSAQHLPGYVKDAEKFKALGVDALWCMAVNDPFVMDRWVTTADPTGEKIFWISDGAAEVSRSMNLAVCLEAIGLGTRCRRAGALIVNGQILHLSVEPPAEFYISSSDYMLKAVKAYLR